MVKGLSLFLFGVLFLGPSICFSSGALDLQFSTTRKNAGISVSGDGKTATFNSGSWIPIAVDRLMTTNDHIEINLSLSGITYMQDGVARHSKFYYWKYIGERLCNHPQTNSDHYGRQL